MHRYVKQGLTALLPPLIRIIDKTPWLQTVLRSIRFPHKRGVIRRLAKPSPGRRVAECLGITYELDVHDLLQREVYYNVYDTKKLSQLLKHIKKEGTYLDIGSNIGFYALHIGKKLSEQGKVYAIEADPEIFKALKKNCQMNRFKERVHPLHLAISNVDGLVNFYTHDQENSGAGSLTRFDHIHGKTIEVKATTLDQFMEQQKIPYVDFAKIDIEGNELELLQGAEKSLEKKLFGKMYIEFNGILLAKKGKTFRHFLDAFAKHRYFPIEIHLDLIQKLENNEISPSTVCTDFLFAPRTE